MLQQLDEKKTKRLINPSKKQDFYRENEVQ